MKLKVALSIAMLGALTATLLAIPQKHPSVDPAAHEVDVKQVHSLLDRKGKVLVIDVRTPTEYARGHIPGSVNIPISVLDQKIREMKVAKDSTIVTTCDHGGRSSRAAMELQKMGYHATSFCRIESWRKDGYKISKGKN
jgi:rhodanese-related sulfurtransferase